MKIIFFHIFILFFLFVGCNTQTNKIPNNEITITSDLEQVENISGDIKFTTSEPNFYLGGGDLMDETYAKSGSHAVKLDSNNLYGVNFKLENVKEGQFVRASIWQKKGAKDGTLIADIEGDGYAHKFRTFYDKRATGEDGWVQHNLVFVVTPGVKRIKIFVFAGGNDAYFDDFSVTILPNAPKNNLKNRLNLYIPEKSKNKLDGFISNALKSEIIASENKKYVKAFILDGEDSLKIKMKLKGDWTDHIKSGKTSFRIKVSGNNSFLGLKTFSIQHPKTRNYIHEWVFHQFSDIMGLLSTKYEFISVTINGFDYGVFALEEHFDKQLVESRKRREGPILKMDESGAWAFHYKLTQSDNEARFPVFNASMISLFKENRTLKNPKLKMNFEEGQVLLHLFKTGYLGIEEVFDIDQLAKFYALMELSAHNHALAWHNRRFYFNPVTQKIEHIVYDVIPFSIKDNFKSNVLHNLLENKHDEELVFDNAILLHRSFKEKYLFYINKMTEASYLDSLFSIVETALNENVEAIMVEEPHFSFNKEVYYKHAAFLKNEIPKLDSIWEVVLTEKNKVDDWISRVDYATIVDSFFVKEISINTYLKVIDSVNYALNFENYHPNSVHIIGYQSKLFGDSVLPFKETINIDAYVNKAQTASATTTYLPSKIVFTYNNIPNQLNYKAVFPFEKPGETTTRMRLETGFDPRNKSFSIQNNKIVFKGKVLIDRLIYIPSQYEVEIAAGTIIEFKNKGGLIINNTCNAIGTTERPIQLICKDGTSNGVTILKGKIARFEHVTISGLSNLAYEKWLLTGALTIYETPTILQHVKIENNHSEDALNIIRSHFEISDLIIQNTTSDGFDADFCTGTLKKSTFKNTGNDCIDFSGSVVTIDQLNAEKSGDKGISGGERSTLTLSNIQIDGAITGIASKDDSKVIGEKISIENAEVAFSAFQKKGEYAPALIDLKDAKWGNIQQVNLIDLKSVIIVNGVKEEGTKKLDIDKMYARFGEKQ
ncbi:hypothetical protein DNU06_13845 [Putridiphycobacter roseus]|uniref:Right handed beta helix domain-containing protein n=1 Tax=Putridiphycobacter roseus TaxID=2219161 RepID=A0A2W1NDQ8_9FLAO|nr:CotH kinase family protein [Putridiphycobacter roseus]PZE16206.1 hypothetical protein DNU06_13845 [Putridiphycobacter roseus]